MSLPLRGGTTAMILGLCFLPALLHVTGSQARVFKEIELRGNRFIASEDITAACGIAAGDYAEEDLADLRDCLLDTGAFRDVALRAEGARLVVDLIEANDRPGRIEAGLAYDSRDGVVGSVFFERYNLFPEVYGSAELTFGEEAQLLRAALYRADAFGQVDLGFDLLLRETDFADQGFQGAKRQIEPYLAYPFANGSRVEIGLGYRWDKMAKLQGGAGRLLSREIGRSDAPYLRFGFRYSAPPQDGEGTGRISGLGLSLDQYVWGLGSGGPMMETRLDANLRLSLGPEFALHLGLRGGRLLSSSGQASRAIDRFFIGGAEFRGFAPRGIGPKEGERFVGANSYAVASLELRRDLGEVLGTSGSIGLFTDIGSAWGLDDTLGGVIEDKAALRSSLGLSLTLDVAKVPVSIYVAKPIKAERGDSRQSFGISFSTAF